MKKILALVLSALMIATTCAGAFAVFAEGEIAPAKLFDGTALNPTNGPHGISGEYDYEEGCIRYTWSVGPGGWDPYFWLYHQDLPNFTAGEYMVVKYRTETEGLTAEPHMGNGSLGDSNAIWEFEEADGEWHKAIVYLPDAITNGKYDVDTDEISHIRMDLIKGEDAEANPDGWLDIEYIAFFDSESDAEEYEHELPVDPEIAIGGCYKTIDFTGKTTEEIAAMFHGDQVQVTFEASEGGVLFTATDADPYVTLKNPGAGDHNLGITGTQGRYVLVKYNANATSNDPMQMALFANVIGLPIQWGHPQSYNEANIVADGEWHYVLFDMTDDWGMFNNGLEAFRLDMLHNTAAGETAEIATIKFFSKEAWVKEYIVAAAATDAAAEEMAVANEWMAPVVPEVAPVVLWDGNKLDPNTGAYCVRGEYDYEAGCIRYTWFDQGIGIDPYFFLHHMDWGTLTVGDYMVIKYRTTTEGLYGAAHTGNGGLGSAQAKWEYEDASGDWATQIIYLPDAIPGFYDPDADEISHYRFEVVEEGQAENPDAWLDVEYIAFFDSESEAEEYEHVLPEEPADPNMAADGSYATFDFTAADADLTKMLRVEGHTGTYGNQMTAELVDGVLRITATGDDPYVCLLHKSGNGAESLGITGKQAKYILVKYKTEANSNDPMEFGFHTNGAGGLGWGPASNMVFPMNNNGEWNYALLDTSALIGSFGGELSAFRFDVMDKSAAGEVIEIASIKFFAKDVKVQDYVMTLVETDAAAEALAIAQGWMTPVAPEDTTVAPEDTTVAPEDTTVAPEDTTVAPEDTTVAPEDTTVAPEDTTVAPEDTTVAPEDTTVAPEDTTVAPEDTTVAPEDTTVAPEDTTVAPEEESTPATEESTPAVEDDTAPATEDDTAAEETTTGEAEETTAAVEADTHAGDESTNAPEAAGCKGVIASASILAVVAMAGVVVCKKKKD